MYTYRNILEYIDGEYVITNPITETNIKEMRNNMDESDVEEFDKFIEKHWGDKTKRESIPVSTYTSAEDIEDSTPKKRGRKPKAQE